MVWIFPTTSQRSGTVSRRFGPAVHEPQLEPAIAARYDAERYASVPGYLVIYATKQ
ncbi:MAG: hypothetical protein M3R61_13560 [Chloroflexota bacterium]|nr:hypothetical protein [Chloroflexota bacterium]